MAVSPRAGAVVSVALVGLLLGGALAPVVTGGALAQQSQPETDNTVTRIEVFENGSARWTVQIRTRLDTDRRVEEYGAFQSRFRNDTDQYLGPFRTRIRGVVANAESATGRQMGATEFTATTSVQEVPRRWGVVTYEFTWTNFAAREDGRVVVGDVFGGGFFIAADDALQVVAPDGYGIARTDPAPDSREDGVVTWNGREDFADGNPTVAFTPAAGQTGGDGALLGDLTGIAVAGLVVVVLLGLVGAVLYGRRDGDTGGPDGTVEAAGGPPASSAGGAGDGGGSQVLTDEERVVDLLEANGGRVRQAEIAESFDWSASKTSRVVGRMAEEGSVEKLQLGRENLVTLPGEDA